MPIPDYQTLMLPVLRFLADGAEHSAQSVVDAMADHFELDAQERQSLLPSGQITVIRSRVHWAMTYLAQAGLSERPQRAVWSITDEGRRALASNPDRIDSEFLGHYESFREFVKRGAQFPLEGEEDDHTTPGLPTFNDLYRPFIGSPLGWETTSNGSDC